MGRFKPYTIPLQGQGTDVQTHDYQLGVGFFSHFEDSLVEGGDFHIQVDVERKSGLMELELDVQGSYATLCDRCLSPIQQKVDATHLLLVKYGNQEDDGEVVYIPENTPELDITKILYDYICLSLPIASYCEGAEAAACDERVETFLTDANHGMEDNDSGSNPFLDALEGLDLDE